MESTVQTSESFAWTTFYTEFADKLLHYKDKRPELLALLKNVFENIGMKYPFMFNGEVIDDICPFTVFSCFNKGITDPKALGKKRTGIVTFVRNL